MIDVNQLAEHIHELNGLTVHTVKTDKYKTNSLILMIKAPLEKETVAYVRFFPMFYKMGQQSVRLESNCVNDLMRCMERRL